MYGFMLWADFPVARGVCLTSADQGICCKADLESSPVSVNYCVSGMWGDGFLLLREAVRIEQ